MTIDEVDQALAEWESRMRRIDQNLVTLQLDPVHTRLQQSRDGGLDDITRERVLPALDAMQELFARRALLYNMLKQATRLRSGINRWRPAETLRQIEGLLRGPSIMVPAVERAPGQRGLLDISETSVTPDQLLNAMVASFEEARDAVATVGQAWNKLESECRQAGVEVDRLQAVATDLGQDATAALTEVRTQLAAVEARIARDPLGATQSLTGEVFKGLRQLDQRLTELQRQRQQVDADLDQARALLAGVRAAYERVTAARDRCSREVVRDSPAPLPLDPGRIDGLAEWLTTLESTAGARRWHAAAVGLARWLTAAQEARGEAEAAERASLAPLDQRDELLGRLLARRQQARTRAARGQALDPALEQVAAHAERLLRQMPAPLAEAATLVADYETGLQSVG